VPRAGTISKVVAYAQTAPTGADLRIDVNKNGSTIFTAGYLTISAGANSGSSTALSVTSLAEADRLSIDFDQIGSTVAGADVTITVIYS
jgi:hypothetical protein